MSKPTDKKSAQCGFSLLEAVIAIGICSFSLVAVFEVLSGGLTNINRAIAEARSFVVAKNIIEVAKLEQLPVGSEKSDVTNQGLKWSVKIEPYDFETVGEVESEILPSDMQSLVRIVVEVKNSNGQTTTLETLQRRRK